MKKLSSMIKSKKPLVIPGVYDELEQKLLKRLDLMQCFKLDMEHQLHYLECQIMDLLVQLKQFSSYFTLIYFLLLLGLLHLIQVEPLRFLNFLL